MKKVYSLAALALMAASGVAQPNIGEKAPKENVQLAHEEHSGQDTVARVRRSFESGGYDAFLANLESDYAQVVTSGQFTKFVEMRSTPPANEKLSQLSKHWEELHHQLILERNRQLLDICNGNDQLVCKQICAIAQEMKNADREALQYLSSLRFKTPMMAKNDDERKLIDLDLESEFKTVHLDMQYAEKPFDNRSEKHLAVNMEMLKKMQEAAKTFNDRDLKNKIERAVAVFDIWQARNFDLNHLLRIAQKPSTDLEKKAAQIMNDYKAKKDDLYQKEFLAQLDKE
jgi:hypothetical protein